MSQVSKCLCKSLTAVCLLSLLAQQARAEIACPLMMFDGKSEQDDLGLTFMNKAKVPIRQIEFYCPSLNGQSERRSVCHTETGIFYPGTPYPIRFSNATKGGSHNRCVSEIGSILRRVYV